MFMLSADFVKVTRLQIPLCDAFVFELLTPPPRSLHYTKHTPENYVSCQIHFIQGPGF